MTRKTTHPGFVARASQAANQQTSVQVIDAQGVADSVDRVTVEEPLEILLAGAGRAEMTLAITMRTPGHDDELAAGFLFSEGIVTQTADVENLEHCQPANADNGFHNSIRVTLSKAASYDPRDLTRHFYTASSCGVCGKTSMDAVLGKVAANVAHTMTVAAATLQALPAALEAQQSEFQHTGGIHAAALFDQAGTISALKEDVGRHNALDKLIGERVLSDDVPLTGYGLLLSGRASFELVQKAAMAGIEIIAAIGPPSSLAVELAQASNITLVGFLKNDRFNVYASALRIV